MKSDSVYREQVLKSFEECRKVPGGELIPEELARINRNSFRNAIEPIRRLIDSLNFVAGESGAAKWMDRIRENDRK